jgi:ADP-heptose:LPS heptosyltransferase
MPILAFGESVHLIAYDPAITEEHLTSLLKNYQFDQAYVLKDEKTVSRAVKAAGIPLRFGPYSSLRSFFLFNEGRFQRRSRCLMHEAEYNLDLVTLREPAGDLAGLPKAWIQTAPGSRERALGFLQKTKLTGKAFIVIHPGSSGSARYVKIEKLHHLAQRLIQKGHSVMISGGPIETEILSDFKKKVPEVVLLSAGEGLELDGLAEVYRCARVVVAHGTGPLHLAAAVNVPVLAIFPPLFVLSETRWGPLCQKRSVWVPEVACPEKYRCRGARCQYFDCMDRFDVENAVQKIEGLCS